MDRTTGQDRGAWGKTRRETQNEGHKRGMDTLTDLEGRLTRALDRIRAGVTQLDVTAAPASVDTAQPAPAPADHSARITELEAALEEERTANAQLEGRVKAVRRKQEDKVQSLRAEIDSLKADLSTAENNVSRLHRVSEELRRASESLRAANEQSVGDARLINQAMMAELEALRAERAADADDAAAILAALEPLAGEANNA